MDTRKISRVNLTRGQGRIHPVGLYKRGNESFRVDFAPKMTSKRDVIRCDFNLRTCTLDFNETFNGTKKSRR